MTEREALKLALDAMECALSDDKPYLRKCEKAITAIKEALAQPEHEPDDLTIAYMSGVHYGKKQRTWVGLTDEEINKVLGGDIHDEPNGLLEFVRAIEAKLKEKNT